MFKVSSSESWSIDRILNTYYSSKLIAGLNMLAKGSNPHPFVYWAQNQSHVLLRVDLKDVTVVYNRNVENILRVWWPFGIFGENVGSWCTSEWKSCEIFSNWSGSKRFTTLWIWVRTIFIYCSFGIYSIGC